MRFRWALCCVLLLLTLEPVHQASAASPIATACEMGLLGTGASALDPDMPMSRALWGLLLYEAFGHSIRLEDTGTDLRDMPKCPEGERLARVCNAQWLVRTRRDGFRPTSPVSEPEAEASLAAVARRLGVTGFTCAAAPRPEGMGAGTAAEGDRRSLGLAQGLEMLLDAIRELAPQPGSPPVPDAARDYYRALGLALNGATGALMERCCGTALHHLAANIARLGGEAGFQLIGLSVTGIQTQGHLAVLHLDRVADFRLGNVVTRSAAQDLLHLRLRPNGWSVYR